MVGGYPGFTFYRWVKLGDPLSAMLFVLFFDMCIKCVKEALDPANNMVCGVGDDIGLALEGIWTQVPIVLKHLRNSTLASSVELNLHKCGFVPLCICVEAETRKRLAERIPGATKFIVANMCAVFRRMVGPRC